jgi:hypothetical protein
MNPTSNLQQTLGLRPAEVGEADRLLELVARVAEELRQPKVAAVDPEKFFCQQDDTCLSVLQTQANN